MKIRSLILCIVLLAMGVNAGAQPRQVSNEPSTESFSGAAQRNWSSLGFQVAYAKFIDESGVDGFGIGANAQFIRINRVGKASLGLDVDAIVNILSVEGGDTVNAVMLGLGPIVKVYPDNKFSVSLAMRPGLGMFSNGEEESDFCLSEALYIDIYPSPEIGIGIVPTITQVFSEEETFNMFHVSLRVSFNY